MKISIKINLIPNDLSDGLIVLLDTYIIKNWNWCQITNFNLNFWTFKINNLDFSYGFKFLEVKGMDFMSFSQYMRAFSSAWQWKPRLSLCLPQWASTIYSEPLEKDFLYVCISLLAVVIEIFVIVWFKKI